MAAGRIMQVLSSFFSKNLSWKTFYGKPLSDCLPRAYLNRHAYALHYILNDTGRFFVGFFHYMLRGYNPVRQYRRSHLLYIVRHAVIPSPHKGHGLRASKKRHGSPGAYAEPYGFAVSRGAYYFHHVVQEIFLNPDPLDVV